MVSATVSLTIFLTLIVWRLVFGLQRRRSMREAAAPLRRDNNFLDLEPVVAIAGDRFVNNSHGRALFERKDRAQTYLRRIAALTGATQAGNSYILDVGMTRFRVRDGYVGRLRDVSNPKCEYEETCFSLPYSRMLSARKLLPHCYSSRAIQRCLTGGPRSAERIRPTARDSASYAQ